MERKLCFKDTWYSESKKMWRLEGFFRQEQKKEYKDQEIFLEH